ncbi:hypothetical protein [Sediminicola luteus]|uniref:Uncharacterized protein n=1 Tax=Sediminicola luteus TaxID=319238 RepID=A0A2A4GBQ7_9FLAO|nr:hypothetical protein [Sediminicola luteus]PCE65883.1 hypothetical protein B7P33_00860 [Sediminicola luteus]
MIKILKYTEYLYLIVAILSAFKIYELWGTDRNYAYIFVFFMVVSVGMFFFKRRYRKRFEQHKKNQGE